VSHHTRTRFNGTGYRAYCTEMHCNWTGPQRQFFKYMGYGQAGALHRCEQLARQDGRLHQRQEEARRGYQH
jgi:hypothetical protein